VQITKFIHFNLLHYRQPIISTPLDDQTRFRSMIKPPTLNSY